MQTAADAAGMRLRPHAKTHKCPRIARWQLEAGAVGVTVAKVGEAEVFADAGVVDVRLAYPTPPALAPRVIGLSERVRLSLVVDHPVVAARWSAAMRDAGRTLDVLVKVDVGYHRCGIDPTPATAVGFILAVKNLPGLRFRGLLSHAGHCYDADSGEALTAIARREAQTLRRLAAAVTDRGVAIEEISVGATPTVRHSFGESGLTEARPGNYVFRDLTQVALGSATLDDCALSVLSTVVSKPTADRIVLDAGSKTLSSDEARGPEAPDGFGAVCPDPLQLTVDAAFTVVRLSEEHAVVETGPDGTTLEPGDRVRLVPNHACVVTNLADRLTLVDGNTVVEQMPVVARGRNS